jgi:hypothetical protein
MTTIVTVQLPSAERDDLEHLAAGLPERPVMVESRAFDGGTVLTALVALGPPALLVLRSWLRGRSEERRATKITVDGKQFEGYSADEVIAVLEALDKAKELDPPHEPEER